MAGLAEVHVVGLILHQQARLGRCMRLMAARAAYSGQDLGCGRVHHVLHRMAGGRVPQAVLQRQDCHLEEVILGQFHLAIEDRHQVLFFELGGSRIRTVALQAQLVLALGAQQFRVFSAMRLVAGRATLFIRRLVYMPFLLQFGLIAVAAQAGGHRIGTNEARRLTRVRAMAIRAIALRAGMLYLGARDLLGLLVVAGHAQFLDAGGGEHHLAVLGRLMAGVAGFRLKGAVQERPHQLWRGRLMRIVAGEAIRLFDRLALMGLRDLRVLGIVTFRAERGAGLGKVIPELGIRRSAGLVGDVAGFAAAIERGVAAAGGWNVEPLGVALQAKIGVFGGAVGGL